MNDDTIIVLLLDHYKAFDRSWYPFVHIEALHMYIS